MTTWTSRTFIDAPRNGTDQHTVTFTPAAAGNLLVMVIAGPVTHSIPAGWTRHAQGLNETEISVYSKTAAGGENELATTHNAANYPVAFVVYEFPSGSTMGPASAQNSVVGDGAGPQISGLTGAPTVFAAACSPMGGQAGESAAVTWANSGMVTDSVLSHNPDGTDGYFFALGYAEQWGPATFQEQMHLAGTTWSLSDQIAFAVNVSSVIVEPVYTRYQLNGNTWAPLTRGTL